MARGDGALPPLDPREAALLSEAARPARRRSFALGRAAARRALEDLRVPVGPVGRGAGGQPIWPPGVVGAITHSQSLGAAVVASAGDYAGVGLDAEEASRLVGARAIGFICGESEQRWIAEAADAAEANARTLTIFCAKEAVFKALYPLEQVYLGFSDAVLAPLDHGSFAATVTRAAASICPAGTRIPVRSWSAGAHIWAVAWLLRPS